jgi:Recombinase
VALHAAVSANAAAFANDLLAVVADIRCAGNVSLRAVVLELTSRGIKTRRGGAWHVSNLKELLTRLG